MLLYSGRHIHESRNGAVEVAWGVLRGVDLNHRPLGYEPNELPDCSTPRNHDNNRDAAPSNARAAKSCCLAQLFILGRTQASTVLVGSTASSSTCSCVILPDLSIRKVARRADSSDTPSMSYFFARPYSRVTLPPKSPSRGKVTPFCCAKAKFEKGLSMLTPRTWVSAPSSLLKLLWKAFISWVQPPVKAKT